MVVGERKQVSAQLKWPLSTSGALQARAIFSVTCQTKSDHQSFPFRQPPRRVSETTRPKENNLSAFPPPLILNYGRSWHTIFPES